MSQAVDSSPAPKGGSKNIPDGLAKGIVGFALGAGLMFLGMHFYGPREKIEYIPPPPDQPQFFGIGGPPAAGAGAAPAGPPAAAASGDAGGGAKLDLTALVGALEVLSRDKPELRVELDQDQAAKIAAELAELHSAETLPAEEAQSRLDAIGSLLKPEQKAVFDSFGVRFERPSDGGSKPDENPFSQGANRQRLEDLLGRLKPAGS